MIVFSEQIFSFDLCCDRSLAAIRCYDNIVKIFNVAERDMQVYPSNQYTQLDKKNRGGSIRKLTVQSMRSTAAKLLGRISFFNPTRHSPGSLRPNVSAALNWVALWSEIMQRYGMSTISALAAKCIPSFFKIPRLRGYPPPKISGCVMKK